MNQKELNCPCTKKVKCNFHSIYPKATYAKSIPRDVIQKLIQEFNK